VNYPCWLNGGLYMDYPGGIMVDWTISVVDYWWSVHGYERGGRVATGIISSHTK
jgi:hypothetical protein